ncbi:CotH kinase family protein [Bacillus massiliigorillae]|uniref:CotH kinase family protein n=1 Tax=Bacillus massiliigorillae TaxID=1243664 RepID=UPI000694743A|nr:CotH kinase family protein [Bacillus massiliigorillae]
MKNRYIVLSIVLMLSLLILVVIYLPKVEQQTKVAETGYVKKVFNQNKVSTVDITMDEKDLTSILENPMKKEVVPATVVINGKKVADVGFRTKGNMTLRSVANMTDSDRYSFKIDFDYYNDGQNLYGLKKLALNNNYSDSTLSREYLSYKLMEKMGIPTPANSYMYVTINGKEWGLYLGVEAIDETFLAQNYEDSTGDLYKPDGTGSDLKWISDDIKDYSGLNLKTNKDSSDQSAMMKLLDVINNGGNLEEVMDVDEMLRYFATNTALVNLDHYQGSMKHNYYLYEQNGIFSILPWDYNMSFGGFGAGGEGNKPQANEQKNVQDENNEKNRDGNMGGMMSGNLMNEKSINFSITTPVSGTTLEDRPLLNALLSIDKYREKYNQYLEEIATTFFTEKNMQTLTNQISATILKYVEKDPTKFTTTEQFLEGVSGDESLVAFAVKRADSILKQLSGELVVEADTSGGFGGGGMPGEKQGQGDMPQLPNRGANDNQGERPQPPEGNGNLPQPPENIKQGEMQPPNFDNQNNPFNFNEGDGPQSREESGNSLQSILMTAGFVLLLLLMIVLASLFKRRRG